MHPTPLKHELIVLATMETTISLTYLLYKGRIMKERECTGVLHCMFDCLRDY